MRKLYEIFKVLKIQDSTETIGGNTVNKMLQEGLSFDSFQAA